MEEVTSGELSFFSLRQRLAMCYILLTQIPEEGLDDLRQRMDEIIEFYSGEPMAETSKQQTIPGELNPPVTRPDFSLDPDEV